MVYEKIVNSGLKNEKNDFFNPQVNCAAIILHADKLNPESLAYRQWPWRPCIIKAEKLNKFPSVCLCLSTLLNI